MKRRITNQTLLEDWLNNPMSKLLLKRIRGKVLHREVRYGSTFSPCSLEVVLDINGKKSIAYVDGTSLIHYDFDKAYSSLQEGSYVELLINRRFKLFNNKIFTHLNDYLEKNGLNMGNHTYYYRSKIYDIRALN